MKIVETISLANSDKVMFGSKELKLTLDTNTRRVEIETPAMFGNSVVQLDELRNKLDALRQLGDDELAARRRER